MKTGRFFSLLLVFFTIFQCTASALAAEDVQIPTPIGDIYVQDFAHVLSEQEKAELISLGKSIEDKTTAQVAVLTVPTIGTRSIDEYANAAFRQYGIGNKKANNGVLLVLSMKEQKVRIEVGYGLEGRIPDGKAGRILDEDAIPYLKKQPNRAVMETYKALAKEVLAEYGKSDVGKQTAGNQGSHIPAWLIIVAIVLAVLLDFTFFGGILTRLLFYIFLNSGGGGGGSGGSKGGGGGSSGGGGASR